MFGNPKIRLDPGLFEKLTRAATVLGYASTEEFILHILEKAVTNLDESMSEEEVRKQLRGLGYIE